MVRDRAPTKESRRNCSLDLRSTEARRAGLRGSAALHALLCIVTGHLDDTVAFQISEAEGALFFPGPVHVYHYLLRLDSASSRHVGLYPKD